jgi:hypothetical protein
MLESHLKKGDFACMLPSDLVTESAEGVKGREVEGVCRECEVCGL